MTREQYDAKIADYDARADRAANRGFTVETIRLLNKKERLIREYSDRPFDKPEIMPLFDGARHP